MKRQIIAVSTLLLMLAGMTQAQNIQQLRVETRGQGTLQVSGQRDERLNEVSVNLRDGGEMELRFLGQATWIFTGRWSGRSDIVELEIFRGFGNNGATGRGTLYLRRGEVDRLEISGNTRRDRFSISFRGSEDRPGWGGERPGWGGGQPAGYSVAEGRYEIEVVATGKFLDLRLEDQRTLQQWGRSRNRNQQWDIERTRDGYYTIRSVENGAYLGIEDRFGRDGAAVMAFQREFGDNVKWQFVDAGRGMIMIVSRGSGRVLDLPSGQNRDGVRFQLWSQTNRDNQRFRLYRVGSIDDRGRRDDRDRQYEDNQAGRMNWRGRVDGEVILEVRGSSVRQRLVSGSRFDDGQATFTSSLPHREVNLRINQRRGRGAVEVIERPSFANNFTALIRIRDEKGGADDYEFELIWN